jgi:hypothetical protein
MIIELKINRMVAKKLYDICSHVVCLWLSLGCVTGSGFTGHCACSTLEGFL